MNVHITKESDDCFRFVLSYGDIASEGTITKHPDPGDGTSPVTVAYVSGKPNITEPSGPVDPDVHVMAAFMEYLSQ